MPVYQRKDFPELLKETKIGPKRAVYLLFGDRYLCREMADELIRHLLPDQANREQQLKAIDGEQVDGAALLAQLRTYSLFGGRQVFRVMDSKVFEAGSDEGELLAAALEVGLPAENILILVAEAVDKRKRLYKGIEKHGAILDLAVDKGASSAARKEQENLLRHLAEKSFLSLNKKLEPRALPVLLERVGFHPVAVVMESEKLALHAGEREMVTMEDLDLLLGRTREEALFELTDAVGRYDLAATLLSLHRLQESRTHGLVIVAGLRNLLKKLLLARSFQEQGHPSFQSGMAFPAFQKGYLVQLKESCTPWPPLLAGHPYVIFKMFSQAEKFPIIYLKKALALLLEAEYRLKSSRLSDRLILQSYCFQLFLDSSRGKEVQI